MKVIVKKSSKIILERSIVPSRFIIGRAPECNLVINDLSISRNHCVVEEVDDGFFVTDVSQVNGIEIDGVLLKKKEKNHFKNLNAIKIGNYEVSVKHEQVSTSDSALELVSPVKSRKIKKEIAYEETEKSPYVVYLVLFVIVVAVLVWFKKFR